MSIKKRNDCVGCPQGCIHCGRGNYYTVECDKCGEEGNDKEIYFEYGGSHFCKDCFPKFLEEEGILKEVSSGVCAYCGEETEKMYEVDGETVCEECLSDYLQDNYDCSKAENILGRD